MDLSFFFGRFHLVLVHLPIGLLLMAVVMYFLSGKKRFGQLDGAIAFSLLLGALSAILAAICGWLLANNGDYVDDTLFLHRWMGIGLTALAGFCWILKTNRIKTKRSIFTFSMTVLTLLIFYTGHLGGNLTHGEGYLLEYAPATLNSLFGANSKPVETSPTVFKPRLDHCF